MLNNGNKETPIGILPDDWRVLPIGNIARTTSGGTPSRERQEYYIGNIPWVKSGELKNATITQTQEHINEEAISQSNAKLFPRGTLLVAMYGATAGKVGMLGIDATTNQAVCAIFPNEEAIPMYLFYVLMHRRQELLGERYGGAQPNISQRVLRDFHIPLPPLPEQRAIAHVLSTVRKAIEATEQVINAARELKRSMMEHLFTYGPVPVDQADQVPLKETEIGEMPDSWKITSLGNISSLITKGSSPRWQGFDYLDDGMVFIRAQNIGWGRLELNDVKYLSYGFNDIQSKSIIKAEDLLITIAGTIGRTALANDKISGCNLNQAVAIVRVDKAVEPEVIMGFFMTEKGQTHLQRNKKRLAQANISLHDIRTTSIPIPSQSEQSEILRTIVLIERKIYLEVKKQKALEDFFDSLLHHLMTGKVRIRV